MIVFISNFLNHHQLSVCKLLKAKDEFYFIANEPVPQEQLRLGYSNMNKEFDFVIRVYESSEARALAQRLLNEADVVIAGSCTFPFNMIIPRLEADKLTFWFSERLFKISAFEFFYPPKLVRVLSQCTRYRKNKNFYLLCAGGYVAQDYKNYNAFVHKSFSWGYFPDRKNMSHRELMLSKCDEKLKVLWAGRYLSWKRPDYALYAAEILREANIEFSIEMIGDGVLYDQIASMIKTKKLDEYIKQVRGLPHEKVIEHMIEAHIFLFTSTRREGWGAVLNESMSSGCAVICADQIGSVKSEVKNGKNGMTFKNKNQFKNALLQLIDNRSKITEIGINAYHTTTELWSAECAAERFYETVSAILNNKQLPEYHSGPMMRIS